MKKYHHPNKSLFIQNRDNFKSQLAEKAVAIFTAYDQMPRSADLYHSFRQNPDLYYLTGLDQEDIVLVLFPNCPKGKTFEEILFIRRTNDYIKVWEGEKYTIEKAREISGIQNVKWLDEMPAILNEMVLLSENIYLNINENDRAVSSVVESERRLVNELKAKYPLHNFHRSQRIMKALRMIKSKLEVEVIQKACDITDAAFRRVLGTTKAGMYEYEVEAEIIYEFTKMGATGHAYHPIIAGGANACVLHYNDNADKLKEGDLLLMDFGCEYGNYASDMTRVIPVGGKFLPRQLDVYNAVLRVMKQASAMLRPGLTLDVYNQAVGKIMEEELVNLSLLTMQDIKNQDPAMPAYKKYFMHGTSHHMGLDVHDLCNRYEVVKEGMVFTCEPGIYIPEEGIGIRLENDLLIGKDSNLDLMANIPLEAEHIEDLMASTYAMS